MRQAPDLIDDAWEATDVANTAMQRALARRALKLDPNEIDGYVILGLALETEIEKIALLREGVRRGKILWSEAMKRPSENYFWGDIHTRPFMRACHNLALLLWDNSERQESVELAKLLYRLNPNDNQGVRYLLMAWLPVVGEWPTYERVLKRSAGELRTEYLYSACLNDFRKDNDSSISVSEALSSNPLVASYLAKPPHKLGVNKILVSSTGVVPGLADEAFEYARMYREAWLSVPNSIKWLQGEAKKLSGGMLHP